MIKIIIVKNLKPKRENDKATTSAKHIQEENLQIRNWDNHKKEETRFWEKIGTNWKVVQSDFPKKNWTAYVYI